MRYFKFLLFIITPLAFLFSCDSTLDVNAQWKDITVVYGILNQNDSIQYLKITKAFLGEGDALMFAQNPDSSNYSNKLDVKIEEWHYNYDGNGNPVDSTLLSTIPFDTTTINNKEKGDSVFYYPYQLVYKSRVSKISPLNQYKLIINNPVTGKLITSQTGLVNRLTEISKPQGAPARATFNPGTKNQVIWQTVKGGKRYQFVARFHYLEVKRSDTSDKASKYVDWIIFNDYKTVNTNGGVEVSMSYSCDAFYTVVGNGIHKDMSQNGLNVEDYTHAAYQMEYIFTIAADDMNTYMEVTEPSSSLVQEKPPYTNINNGIGLFSSRYDNTKDYPIIQTAFSVQTLQELRVNPATSDLGF